MDFSGRKRADSSSLHILGLHMKATALLLLLQLLRPVGALAPSLPPSPSFPRFPRLVIQKRTHHQKACWRPPLPPGSPSLERELPDTQEQMGTANKTNVVDHAVRSLAPESPRRCGAPRWFAMNKPLLSGYVDEIICASRSLYQSMFWDEAAASFFKASLIDVVIARLAKVAVKMDFCCYFTTYITVHSMVEINT